MNFIAVDVGSTFIKAAIYDLEHPTVLYTKKCHTPQPLSNPDPRYFEVDAMAIVDVIRDIIAKCAMMTRDIQGILFSTQQHGCVLSHPQRPRDTYISWQDTRCLKENPRTGRRYMEDLEEMIPPEVMESTGVPIKPALALCNLYTLFQEENLSSQGEVRVDTLGSYIIHQLTGQHICHITNAAPMGFVDLGRKTWNQDILARAGLGFLRLPEIVSDLSCCGYYDGDGLNLAVYPDLGDVQTSVFGTGAKSGDMVIHIGTSGQLILIRDEYLPGNYEIRPYFDNNYCYVVSRMPGGRNFDVQIDYMRQVGEKIFGISLSREEIWQRIQRECTQGESTGGLEVDCGFYELPDRLADGKILHINHANFTPEHVISATAQDYGRQYKRFAAVLCRHEPFQGTLHFAGGAVLKNPFLRDAICRELGVSASVTAQQDEVYSGMFRLAQRCVAQQAHQERGNAS